MIRRRSWWRRNRRHLLAAYLASVGAMTVCLIILAGVQNFQRNRPPHHDTTDEILLSMCIASCMEAVGPQ